MALSRIIHPPEIIKKRPRVKDVRIVIYVTGLPAHVTHPENWIEEVIGEGLGSAGESVMGFSVAEVETVRDEYTQEEI